MVARTGVLILDLLLSGERSKWRGIRRPSCQKKLSTAKRKGGGNRVSGKKKGETSVERVPGSYLEGRVEEARERRGHKKRQESRQAKSWLLSSKEVGGGRPQDPEGGDAQSIRNAPMRKSVRIDKNPNHTEKGSAREGRGQ